MRHACPMGKPDEWERLIQQLDTWTSASEIAPGRIEVSVPHEAGRRQVVVVMTADEWDDMVGVRGSFDSALKEVKAALSQLRPDDAFAVYSQYRLCPSAEATLPVSPVPMPEPSGTWVVHDHDGRVESRFAD